MGKQHKQAASTGSTAGPTAVAPVREARRQAWNASTRLTVRTRAAPVKSDAAVEDHVSLPHPKGPGNAELNQNEGDTQSHSRCSSPRCRDRRSKRQVEFAESRAKQPPVSSTISATDPTRAMIERAVDSALSSAMQDADLTLDESVELVEQPPRQQPRLLDLLSTADADAQEWRRQYVSRRQQNDRSTAQQHELTQKAAQVQRVIRSARFEYEQRKLEIQSLQKRVQREIHFLQATAAKLAEREALMDEAFAGYEQCVRSEWDEDNARAG